ncbi:MAG TPA: CPBP family intramembrane glutamic endopeptidase [Acidobacteriaceae bacterium]|nr:CPBP family intramembrane glutamic endopeptidase [Acidobacteriaceae bacterium]
MHIPLLSLPAIAALLLLLAPLFCFGFAGDRCVRDIQLLPLPLRLAAPAALVLPWLLVSLSSGTVKLGCLLVYLLVPVVVASLLALAAQRDPEQRSHPFDYVVLVSLGLAVDLRWLEPAWPPHLSVFGKLTLLDAGLYGFLAIRQLSGVGFDLRLRARDLRIGLREFLFYAPIAIPLGLALGFLHFHTRVSRPWLIAPAWLFTFIGVALPEEIFFRGWMQNLLERRIGRVASLLVTACLFGLSHFNKRTAFFNWRYVLLAAIAGIFYGRAWRQDRRIGASAITHATVDTIWGALLR